MKKITISLLLISALLLTPYATKAASTRNPAAPTGYIPLSWVKAPGITSFISAPSGNGYIDYLTIINLSQNQIKLASSSTPPVVSGPAVAPFDIYSTSTASSIQNWAVAKMAAEQTKIANPDIQFFWNVPFFNITLPTTDLSLSLKTDFATSSYITSGSRPAEDTAENRRMLIIDNVSGTAHISDFDEKTFINSGDQAVEGFGPFVTTKGTDAGTARLFLGTRAEGKELVVYCSRGATPEEARNALIAADVSVENQLQADAGTSATCAYNLPGQYFVEPARTLPYLMGAQSILYRATPTTDGLNVRTGPGTNFPSVRKLNKTTPVLAYQEKNGWVRISNNQEWVFAKLLKKI